MLAHSDNAMDSYQWFGSSIIYLEFIIHVNYDIGIYYNVFYSCYVLQKRQDSSGPAPIPPPRPNRAKKVHSSPAGGKAPVLPPPAPSSRNTRRNQEGQLINIDDSPSQTPTKPTRTFPSPLTDSSTDAPLINVLESPVAKSPSASRLLEYGDSDNSSDDGRLDVRKSLKGSNSSPNLVTYENKSQSETLADTFSSMNVGNTTTTQQPSSTGNSFFSDSFNPVVTSAAHVVQSSPPPAFSSSSSSSIPPLQPTPAMNPFSDSFNPMTMSPTVSKVATTAPSTAQTTTTTWQTTSSYPASQQRSSLPAALMSAVPLGGSAHPAYMSQVPLQPTSVQKRSKSETEAPKDPFADLVSLQLKGKNLY